MIDYNYYLYEAADPRSKEWMLMSGPIYPIVMCGTYLYLIYSLLPNIMKNRKAYSLTRIIRAYNVLQVILNSYLIYSILTAGWLTSYSDYLCQPVDYSTSPEAMQMLSAFWMTMMVKFLEFVETIFFVLRKKYNQVSALHVYHHVSTFLFTWYGTRYCGGGAQSAIIMLNSFVHVIMYSYYLLSSFGPRIQKKIAFIKPRITQIQLAQFLLIVVYCLQGLRSSCNTPKVAAIFFMPNVILIAKMFVDFYIDNYLKNKKTKVHVNGKN